MNKIEFIKSRTDCISFLRAKNIPIVLGKNIKCPLGTHEDKNPSFSVFDKGQAWKCFSCGESGDVIDLFAKTERRDAKDAIDDLFLSCGGKINEFVPKFKSQIEKNGNEVLKKWIEERKIDFEKVKNFVGFEEKFGKECLTLAIKNQKGEPVGIQRRVLSEKSFFIDGENGFFFSKIEKSGDLFICEGVADFLTLRQFTPSVLGFVSASNSLEIDEIIQGFSRVFWLGDNDQAGEKQKEKFLKLFPEIDIYEFDRPHKKDVNDLWREYQNDDFVEMLKTNSKITRKGRKVFEKLSDIISDTITEAINTPDDKIISYGIPEIDACLCGIFPSSLVVVAAETGKGKSEFVGNLAFDCAKNGKKIAYFDLENDVGDFVRRKAQKMFYAKYREQISPIELRTTKMIQDERKFDKLSRVFEEIETTTKNNIWFYDNRKIPTIEEFINYLENPKIADADLIVIDHLHYFDFDNPEKESINLGRLMRTFRVLTREKRIPIVAVSHLRKLSPIKNYHPTKEDLFGSSNIAKEASAIIIFSKNDDQKYNTRIKIDKNRDAGVIAAFKAEFNQKSKSYGDILPFDEYNSTLVDENI